MRRVDGSSTLYAQIIKKEIPKDEANELLEKLKEIGAEVALE
jgi:ribosomal protein L7/L12